MEKYKETAACAYRSLYEETPADQGRRAVMNDHEEAMKYEGMDVDSMTDALIGDLKDDLLAILREFAMEDRAGFETNKNKLFREIERFLREPKLRELDADTWVGRETGVADVA